MVTDFYPPYIGGVEVLVSNLSHELVRRGHEVAVATLSTPDAPPEEVDDGIRVHRIRTTTQRARSLYRSATRPWAPPVPDPAAVAHLRTVVAKESPEIVHGHDWLARSYLPLSAHRDAALVMSLHYFTLSCPKKNLMFEGTPCDGPRLAKCLGCAQRHYGTMKGAGVTIAHRAGAAFERRLVDLFLPVSEATAAGNQLEALKLPYVVLPNVVPRAPAPAAADDLLQSLPDAPFLLFVGDVRRDKGVDVLLDAYERLAQPPPLVLIGKVWPDTPSRLPDGARLLRDWPNAAVREAMRRCLALVVPSIWLEPFGIVAAEALAAGRPVIASAIGGLPEIVRDEQEGLLVMPGDPDALAHAIDRLVRDSRLRERLASNALQRAARFTPEVLLPELEAAYSRALRARAGRAG
jgi:glycosyltransferase involved in cell wall biosynthesis